MTDPRFDPVFQRGYTGPAPELVVREQARQAPQAPPRPQVVPDAAAPGVAEVPVAEDAPLPDETILDSPADEPWQSPRNPFALASLVGGLILFVLGMAMVWSTAAQQNSGDTQAVFDTGAQALAMLSYLLPPALLLGGILGVLGWLILGALGALGISRSRDRTP